MDSVKKGLPPVAAAIAAESLEGIEKEESVEICAASKHKIWRQYSQVLTMNCIDVVCMCSKNADPAKSLPY